jgi:hypothetical protein
MPDYSGESIPNVRERLRGGMVSYMNAAEGPGKFVYSQEDIESCLAIVDRYLAKVSKGSLPKNQIIKAVELAVVELNVLNENCDGNLIETDQREDLCALILGAAQQAGLDTEEDITEMWREW